MGKAIEVNTDEGFKEGEIFIKWMESRLIRHNQNVLGAELGGTGSGKSYRDLRKAELWYEHHFHEKVPEANICFGVEQALGLIASGKLRKGDIIIFEEAGANMGSLDFQNRVSKMFSYVLQSFRSMNIAIFFNLPYLSMLNSQARHLLHYSFESAGIDRKKNWNKCKPFFHQVNQGTGKIYKKYPVVKLNGKTRQVKRFRFSMPSQYLIDAYEKKKSDYLMESINKYSEEVKKINNGTTNKKELAQTIKPKELKAYNLYTTGAMRQPEIAQELGVSQESVSLYIKKVKQFTESHTN